jgi:hypothetical protein
VDVLRVFDLKDLVNALLRVLLSMLMAALKSLVVEKIIHNAIS